VTRRASRPALAAPTLAIVIASLVSLALGAYASDGDSAARGRAETTAKAGAPAYDPFEGVDPNGRIPRAVMPTDIAHPERWRYIPEGRIKPGNVFRRLLVSSFVAPFVFRDGDVGTGFGVALTDIDFRRQRRREFAGLFLSYTTKGQQRYGLVWRRWLRTRDLEGGGVIQEERSFLRVRAGYRKTLTRRFFGFGSRSREADESSYTDEAFELALGASWSLPAPVDDLVLEGGLDFESHALRDGHVSGRPNTGDAYPEIFEPVADWRFGRLSLEVRWDTRDSQRNPYRGWDVGLSSDALLVQTNSFVGAVFKAFATRIFEVPGLFHRGGDAGESHPPTDVLAFGLSTQWTGGRVPFFLLPTLGGTRTQRGYIDGRWRDRAAWHGSAEYRLWVIPRGVPITRSIRIERIGLAFFYEVGSVAGDSPALLHARPAHSYGVGGRISLERAALFRMDLGFSREGLNFAAGFGVSF